MDKIALISDVHGNIPALETVLGDIQSRGIDLIYNLGDLVGKGGSSALALDRCREVCQVTVRGNWDTTQTDPETRKQLGEARQHYLRDLPNSYDFWMSGKRVRLVHASPQSEFYRVPAWSSYEEHLLMFANTDFTGYDQPEPDIVAYGDIHLAYMITLYHDHKILLNAGSVGNPLDIPLASYAILTGCLDSQKPGGFNVEFIRLEYDIERAIADARQANVRELEAYEVELRTAVYRGRQKKSIPTG